METEKSDYELIVEFRNGCEASFETLYFRYRKQLYGFLNNLIAGNPSEADEVFEETWLRVIDKLGKYRDDNKFGAWLFRIARNLYLDKLRRIKASRVIGSIDEENVPDNPGPITAEPDFNLNLRDLGGALNKLLAQLAPEQRETFLLRTEDFSFKEIAEIQKCPLNTALARMRYAVSNLKKLIRQSGLEELEQ